MSNWNYRNSRGAMASEESTETLDRQNQFMAENLAHKVARLKNLAVDIETESKDSNKFLNGMDGDFDGATGLLSGSLKRINSMMSSGKGNRRLMCYCIGGLIITFFFLYFGLSWIRS